MAANESYSRGTMDAEQQLTNLDMCDRVATKLSTLIENLSTEPVSNHPRTIRVAADIAPDFLRITRFYAALRRHITEQLIEYVNKYVNGVTQRSPEWMRRKLEKIGGSQIASVMKLNSRTPLNSLIRDKIGIGDEFVGNTATAWGTILEPVIQWIIEEIYDTRIVGDDIYIENGDIGFSPDGMGVITRIVASEDAITIDNRKVLFEFKCPFSRMPNPKVVPPYYVPQIQLGLEHIRAEVAPDSIADGAALLDMGMLVEAVFRICPLAQLGEGIIFNECLGQKAPVGAETMALGIIGLAAPQFHSREVPRSDVLGQKWVNRSARERLYDLFADTYTPGTAANNYFAQDIGGVENAHRFDTIMAAFNAKLVKPWLGHVALIRRRAAEIAAEENLTFADAMAASQQRAAAAMNGEVARLREHCRVNGLVLYGVIPYKLLSVTMHEVFARSPPIMTEFGETISTTCAFIRRCLAAPLHHRLSMFEDFTMSSGLGGFVE